MLPLVRRCFLDVSVVEFKLVLFLISGALLMTAVITSTPVRAENVQDSFEVNFQLRETKRRALVASTMGFSAAEAEKFWPVYDVYRAQEKNHQLRRLKMLQIVSKVGVGMDEKTGDEIVNGALQLEADQTAAKNTYIKTIRKTFSGARFFRLYQLETKIAAIFTHGWTRKIPLAVTNEEAKILQDSFDAKQAAEHSKKGTDL